MVSTKQEVQKASDTVEVCDAGFLTADANIPAVFFIRTKCIVNSGKIQSSENIGEVAPCFFL